MTLERFRLDGKVAVITGAGRGLGKQMCLALACAGADLVLAARTQAQIDEVAAEVQALGRRAVAMPTDVRHSEQCNALVQRCLDEFGRIDVMIANAGIGDARSMNRNLWDITDNDWADDLAVNLSSTFYCARAAIKPMVEQGGGVVINTASGTALRGYPQGFGYGAAKAGVIAFTKSLAMMFAKQNVRVNCIVPGFISQKPPANEEEAQRRDERGKFVPVGRLGETWEIGALAVYLASDASSYVTGRGFIIDGGGLADGLAPVGFAPEVALS